MLKNCYFASFLQPIFTDYISEAWAQFVKTGEIVDNESSFVADEFKNGHCVITMEYFEYFRMVRFLKLHKFLHNFLAKFWKRTFFVV